MMRSVDRSRPESLLCTMKTRLSLFSIGVLAAVHTASAAGPTIPQRPAPDTFQKLTEDWPFALATPVVAVAPSVVPWSSNYFVSGIGKSYENGTEEVFVAIKKKDGTGGFSLYGNQVNRDEDVSVGGVEWAETYLKSRVTLKKGSEFATIEFDQAASQQVPQMPGGVRPGMPNLPGAKQPMIRPPGAPGIQAIPRPVNPSQLMPQAVPVPMPGPSNTNAAPMPANTNANAVPNAPKQRVRVIKSTP